MLLGCAKMENLKPKAESLLIGPGVIIQNYCFPPSEGLDTDI